MSPIPFGRGVHVSELTKIDSITYFHSVSVFFWNPTKSAKWPKQLCAVKLPFSSRNRQKVNVSVFLNEEHFWQNPPFSHPKNVIFWAVLNFFVLIFSFYLFVFSSIRIAKQNAIFFCRKAKFHPWSFFGCTIVAPLRTICKFAHTKKHDKTKENKQTTWTR